MACSSEEMTRLQQLVEVLGSRDWRAVAATHEALIAAGSEGIAAVIRGLSHTRPRVRRGCAEFLDHNATDACTQVLSEIARHDPVPNVRRVAVHSLGCQRCKPAPLQGDLIAFLIERATSDESIRVRREAVGGLSLQPPDARAAEALQRILSYEIDRDLRRGAHYALRHHDPAYRRATDEEARVRGRAQAQAKAHEAAVLALWQSGQVSTSRAAEELDLTFHEFLDLLTANGLAVSQGFDAAAVDEAARKLPAAPPS